MSKAMIRLTMITALGLLQVGCGTDPTTGGGGGFNLSSVTQLVQSATGAASARQMVQMQSTSVINSLNMLSSQLPYVMTAVQGSAIYQALNNAAGQIGGGTVNLPTFTTQYPSVNVVREAIALIQTMVNSQMQYLNNMNVTQLQAYAQRLQQANNTILNASAVRPGMQPGMQQPMMQQPMNQNYGGIGGNLAPGLF